MSARKVDELTKLDMFSEKHYTFASDRKITQAKQLTNGCIVMWRATDNEEKSDETQ